jgi:hypothetical protein
MTNQPILSDTESIDIIDVIRKLRNDLIKDFLDERILIDYLSAQFKIMTVSAVKVEFIKADLRRMLISPVDTELYKPIIEDFKATGSAFLSERNEKLFYKEIEGVLKKFIYGSI